MSHHRESGEAKIYIKSYLFRPLLLQNKEAFLPDRSPAAPYTLELRVLSSRWRVRTVSCYSVVGVWERESASVVMEKQEAGLGAEPTVLINMFEVDEGKEEEFFAPWKECSEYVKQQDGYISHRFYKSLDAGARFQYVNVAMWQSPRHFQGAVSSPAFRELVQRVPCKRESQFYRVIEDEHK